MNNNDKLIQSLCEDLTPVTPPKPVSTRVAIWIVPILLCGLIGFFTIGFREEIFSNISQISFIIENILILIAGILLAAAAFISSIPAYNKIKVIALAIISLGIWLGIFIFKGFNITSLNFITELKQYFGMLCTADIIMLSIIPGIITFIMLKRTTCTNIGCTGGLALLAIASLSALSSRFLCHIMDPSHLIIWHFIPVLIMGLFGILLGRLLLKW